MFPYHYNLKNKFDCVIPVCLIQLVIQVVLKWYKKILDDRCPSRPNSPIRLSEVGHRVFVVIAIAAKRNKNIFYLFY